MPALVTRGRWQRCHQMICEVRDVMARGTTSFQCRELQCSPARLSQRGSPCLGLLIAECGKPGAEYRLPFAAAFEAMDLAQAQENNCALSRDYGTNQIQQQDIIIGAHIETVIQRALRRLPACVPAEACQWVRATMMHSVARFVSRACLEER